MRDIPRRYRIVMALLLSGFILWFYPDIFVLVPCLLGRSAFQVAPQILRTPVNGVYVMVNGLQSDSALDPEHLNTDWFLEESTLSDATLDFAADTTQDQQLVREKIDVKLEEVTRSCVVLYVPISTLSVAPFVVVPLRGLRLRTSNLSLAPLRVLHTIGTAQEAYLSDKLDTLHRIGIITPIKDAHWSPAVFVVPKPNKPDQFRIVTNLRPLNSRVMPTALETPTLGGCLRSVTHAHCFGCFGVLSGFDLLRCTKRAFNYFVLATFKGL